MKVAILETLNGKVDFLLALFFSKPKPVYTLQSTLLVWDWEFAMEKLFGVIRINSSGALILE